MTVGKTLDASTRQTAKPLVEGYFLRLMSFTKNDKLASRIKFMCRDVIDLRKNKWIPRREKLEAKTIEQVHAEVSPTYPPQMFRAHVWRPRDTAEHTTLFLV